MQPTIDPIEAQAPMLATALDWLMAPRALPIEADESEEEERSFPTNVPVEVALAFTKDLTVEGRFGDQRLHTFTDEHKRCAPPILAQRKADPAAAGEEV